MKHTRLILLLTLVLEFAGTSRLAGQYYSSGQDPASLSWQKIKTPHFRIIFPVGFEKTAQYVANVLEYAHGMTSRSLPVEVKNIPVILHNQSAKSNAQSLWAPRRMDFFTIPSQITYGQEWFQQLALHEYRHIIEISKMEQGLTRVLTYLFGEQITAAVLGLYVPFWFIEGDATCAETALSKTGRGRTPAFGMPLRAQLLEKGTYPYDKATLGSYKDYIPDYYVLGYHFVAQTRKNYGYKLWDHVMNKVARNPYMVVPFSEGIRDITQMNKTGLYAATMNELTYSWQQQDSLIRPSKLNSLPHQARRVFTDYTRPCPTTRGTIISEKKELDDLSRFIEIDSVGNETLICTPGYYSSVVLSKGHFANALPSYAPPNNNNALSSLSYSKGLLAWTEPEPDPRWSNRDYSIVKIHDQSTGQTRKLASATRYYGPSLSPDATKVAAVHVSEDNVYSLVIIEVASGSVIQSFTTPENYFFTTPAWREDNRAIAAILMGDKGKCLALFDLFTSDISPLTDFSYTEISKPAIHGNRVVFVGSWSGIDNLYLFDLVKREIRMITSSKYGVTDPQFNETGDKVYYSEYTANGFDICSIDINHIQGIPLSGITNTDIGLAEVIAAEEGTFLDPEAIPDTEWAIKKYPKLLNLFNFHSWAPIAIDVNNYEFNPGVSLMSQNLLSTTFMTLGYKYNMNEETGKYYINLSYEGLYPIFDFQADWGRRKSWFTDSSGARVDYSWMETNFSTVARVPLNFTSGKYRRFIQPSVEFTYTQLDMDEDSPVRFRRSNYKTLNYRLYAYHLLRFTEHDMNPRWGQLIDLNYRTAPIQSDTLGNQFAAETRVFFPGIFRHHSFNIYAGYQTSTDENFPFYSSIVNYPRGISNQHADQLVSCSFNYKLPIFYPDFSLWSLAYLKRFKANLFFDYAEGTQHGAVTYYHSAGAEIFADLHLLRFLAPIELGYRLAYLPDYDKFDSMFLFSVNFSSF